jgi:hypothetical protein
MPTPDQYLKQIVGSTYADQVTQLALVLAERDTLHAEVTALRADNAALRAEIIAGEDKP